ncbi:class I SAM-dependent methyltransferase [Amycolatopsis aidingensis]|uniref:class I SAM-dependent methyltransferase n=1 Tax=Amycolatopsis aidingensis TaxID=2842453 RepID=UPI001C0CE0F6|nr:class I SAM-dependent methyltransferase [Amycolatopsis aidingensis]
MDDTEGWEARADLLATRSLAEGDATGWFDRLYREARAGSVAMPWNRREPSILLAQWARQHEIVGTGRRALVVGCGLGSDAEFLASLGFDTTAFDVSATAVQLARERNPGSAVRYRVADLLDPPPEWAGAFDLVLEIHTVQALPDPPRAAAIGGVRGMVAPGGTLLVVAAGRDEPSRDGPPWPLTPADIEAFGADGLAPVRIERLEDSPGTEVYRWRAEFRLDG